MFHFLLNFFVYEVYFQALFHIYMLYYDFFFANQHYKSTGNINLFYSITTLKNNIKNDEELKAANRQLQVKLEAAVKLKEEYRY